MTWDDLVAALLILLLPLAFGLVDFHFGDKP